MIVDEDESPTCWLALAEDQQGSESSDKKIKALYNKQKDQKKMHVWMSRDTRF